MSFTSIGDLAARLTSGARESRVRNSLPANPTADDIIAAMASRLMAAANKQWGTGDKDRQLADAVRNEPLARKLIRESGERAKAAILANPTAEASDLAREANVSVGTIGWHRRELRKQKRI